ncbi:MAG: hypothetical protein DMD84_25790 [Candidatus Rokuibacteriota bacterium]|nr:MAG: hypothetical protein DMD84_25790 [Candidatus Rokubacteria bacterium]
MMIRVSELEDEGLAVTDPRSLEPAFSDPSWRLDALSLTIAPDGVDVVVQGRMTATVPQTCGRCLESFPARVDATVDVRLVPRPATKDSVELGADDLDVDFYVDDQLDLNRVVETETTLALPMKPLCREDCRGLCPACGGNRNLVACACAGRASDPRLAALRDLATRLRH